jgi:hypothetical protein
MVTGPGASQIFTFDTRLYIQYILYIILTTGACIGAWWLVQAISKKGYVKGKNIGIAIAIMVGST